MARRYKKSKREREAAKKRHLTPAERRKKEKHKKNRELRQRKLLELQQKNENNIKSCFSVTPAYWGIDNCTVSILSPEVTYDSNVFDEQIFKETVSLNYNSEGELDKITIQSEDLGKVTISLKEEDYKKKFAAIQLNGPSPNFQTTGINGIKLRLLEVLHKLERDYKIKIKYNPDYVRFKKIELAFTIAFDKLPSLPTRQFLIRSLAKEKKADLKNHRTSKNADGFSMITSKINQKEIHTFYNKIEKAKKNKQIRKINSSLNNLEIFRYEIELTDNNIADKLDSHFLTELTDEKIIQYLESILSLAIFEYVEILEKSISSCNRKLKKIYRECKPQDYMTVFLLFVIDQLSNTTVSDLIDEEIITFLPLEFLKTNRGTTKRRILERLQSHEVNTETKHALGKMTSWHVLEIIRVMFHSLEEAKKYGLGTRINPSTTSYKTFPLKTYSLEERNKIFNNTIKKNTKVKLEDKMLKLILKRLRDGIKI